MSGVHVLTIALDHAIAEPGSEPRRRQQRYAELMAGRDPGAGLTVLVLGARGAPVEDGPLRVVPVPGGRLGSLVGMVWRMLAEDRRRPYGAVAVQRPSDEGLVALAVARVLGCRGLAQLHWDLTSAEATAQYFPGLIGRLRLALQGFALRRASAVRCVTSGVAARLSSERHHGRVVNLPVAVDLLRREPPAPPREPLVLFVGRLAPEKDLATWLRAAALIAAGRPQVRFAILGDGPEGAAARVLTADLGLAGRVDFPGRVAYDELPAWYARAALLLVSSRHEGFGRVAVEAMACRTPVVGTACGGLADIVADGATGLLRPIGDHAALAAASGGLLDDPARAAAMGEAARAAMLARYHPDACEAGWSDLLLETGRWLAAGVLPPRRRTLRRWAALAFSRRSLLRGLEYEGLAGLSFTGRVLDIGGGGRADYGHRLRIDGRLESLNIDPGMRPDHLHDLSLPLPFADGSFDAVVSFNTLEHVPDDRLVVTEALRVLRPGGRLLVTVPWLFRVHASPWDFQRRTPHWWRSGLIAAGADPASVVIDPLGWSVLTLATSQLRIAAPGMALRALAMLQGVAADLLTPGTRQSGRRGSADLAECAEGWLITATKAGA